MLKPADKAAVFALLAACAGPALAAAPEAASAPVLAAGSVLQVVLGLAAVLALLAAAAWLLKRFSSFGAGGSGLIRIVGAAAVGQRERVVVVEVGGIWLLLGVAPGQVRALHTMARNECATPGAAAAPDAAAAQGGFATRLRRLLHEREHA